MELAIKNEIGDRGLVTLVVPTRRIGCRTYSGRSVAVRALHVTYQQKLYVSGYIAPTVGGIRNGDGAIFGGGGTVGSGNDSVVTVVHVDSGGVEGTTELPSGVSVREGTTFRMDFLDDTMFAARNISGNQTTRRLRGPSNFIPGIGFRKLDAVLCAVAAMGFAASSWLFVGLCLARPAWVVWRRVETGRHRKKLGEYMATVSS